MSYLFSAFQLRLSVVSQRETTIRLSVVSQEKKKDDVSEKKEDATSEKTKRK